ncbi:MAG: dTDP-4-dehydrorhamnose reductase [Gemmobacter sp.]
MRVLVFGRTGQVARAVAAAVPGDVGARFLGREAADLADPDACARRVAEAGCDAVVIAAAHTAVDRAEAEEDLARRINADAPGAIGRAAAARGLPVVHLSSDYVLAGTGSAPQPPDAPTGPLSAYGRTKLGGEVALRASGARHLILRTSWVFSGTGGNFVAAMLRAGAARRVVRVVADQRGGPTPAAALAEAVFVAARALVAGHPGGTHHFAGTPDVSWAEFARAIFAAAAMDVAVEEIATADYPTPARRPANSRLDCTGFERAFGLARPDWRAHLPGAIAALRAAA